MNDEKKGFCVCVYVVFGVYKKLVLYDALMKKFYPKYILRKEGECCQLCENCFSNK